MYFTTTYYQVHSNHYPPISTLLEVNLRGIFHINFGNFVV